ncbi:MAG: phosphohydrolase, partial [Eubacterium sp.]|nr:phosphohydrolase [Eubacterium sp.]
KIVALGDKLSNMRSIARDFGRRGDHLWQHFHSQDYEDHAWYYQSLLEALSDLSQTEAYMEFKYLVQEVFPPHRKKSE